MDGFEFLGRLRSAEGMTAATVMMLTADRRTRDLARCRELGIAGYVFKPIRQTELLEAITVAVDETKMAGGAPPDKRPAPAADLRPLHILLVEDASENRLLIQRYLEKTPYQLDMAENGKIALEKFQSGEYDLVLMDMQMPVMDGYTATTKIKSRERKAGLSTTPVIALTAHATKEEERKGLDAGCIAYLTKPIKKAELIHSIYEYTHAHEGAAAQGADGRRGARVVAHVDAELEDLMPAFLENRRRDVIRFREALAEGDYESIRILGHTLKGGGGGYGLDTITRIGRAIENAARERKTENIKKHIDELSHYLEHVEVVYL
jgi:CheY-like chemotaxis protein